ncbi:MAG: hypothetical protein KF680_07795 [Cryobacterium sp.]|nr:hypothetical protein [Cryobacterium sp.]
MARSFDLDPLHVTYTPTPAALLGDAVVFQHSWCGATIVWRPTATEQALGPCPACDRPEQGWWRQKFPVSGFAIRPAKKRQPSR